MIKRLLIILACVGVLGVVGGMETRYTREVTVIEVQGDEVLVANDRGIVWAFKGEGFVEGQEITVVMDTQHTTKITDDPILGVKNK